MKQTLQIPEDLKSLSDDELTSLADQIREAGESLVEDAANDDAALAEIERLVGEIDRIEAEQSARSEKAEERRTRAAQALNRFQGEEEIVAETSDEEEEDEPEAEVQAEPIAASTETVAEAPVAEATTEAPAEAAAEETVVEPIEVVAVTTDEATATVETPAEAVAEAETSNQEAAVSDTPIQSTSVATLSGGRSEDLAPRVEEAAPEAAPLVATNAATGFAEGTPITRRQLATVITNKRLGMNSMSTGTYERIALAGAQAEHAEQVAFGELENYGTMERVRREWAAERKHVTRTLANSSNPQSLVAAGGVCAPLAPSYDFFRLAEPANPVESSLPTVEAPRGGIRFISPPSWRDGAAGVRITTEEQDAAGYTTLPDPLDGPTEPKPCVRVVCPPVEECRVDAVSQCVTFGNLNYRVFPEQVDAFLADLAVIFTQVKEVFYLDAIDAASTEVTFSPAYSAVRGTTYTLLAAAANYRRRHHMPLDSTLTLYLPSWMIELLKVDLINDHSMGLGFIGAGEAEVRQAFASMNLDITWYYDSATGAGQGFDGDQDEGALNEFPTTVVAYLFAPGTFVRLSGGTLDVGLVRDSVLNGTNDLQLFSEEWIQVCKVGLESLRLEITLCPDGTAPEPVVPLECAAASA